MNWPEAFFGAAFVIGLAAILIWGWACNLKTVTPITG